MRKAFIFITFLFALHLTAMAVEPAFTGCRSREYTVDYPLVYEDEWEKWPYAFINDQGEPDGFNVELVRNVMSRLGIPYVIKLCDQSRLHEDFKARTADLSFCVSANYNAPYGRFGKANVTYSDNALLQPRADSTGFYTLDDLRGMHISVKKNSRAHHFVENNGFNDTLLSLVDDIEEEVLRIATEQNGAVLWNKMMLKWVINKYHLQGLSVSPVDIPRGPYNFMSGDTILLARLDSICEIMQAEGDIDRMMTHWLYPERKVKDYTYIYVWGAVAFVLIVMLIVFISVNHYRKYYSRNTLQDISSHMGLILKANDMQVWVYYPQTGHYAWMSRDGKVSEEFLSFDFSQFYPESDFNIIHTHVTDLLSNDTGPVVCTLRSYSLNTPDKLLDVEVYIQTLRDDYGKIYLVCGVQHDITGTKALLDNMRLLHERYKVAFDIALGAILRFDANGTLVDINDRGCAKMGITDKAAELSKNYNFRDFGTFADFDFDTMPNDVRFVSSINNVDMCKYMPIARIENFNPNMQSLSDRKLSPISLAGMNGIPEKGYYYVHLLKASDEQGRTLSVTMFLLDITERIDRLKRLKRMRDHEVLLEAEKDKYRNRRNYTLRSHGIMMFRYRPDTKKVIFYDHQNQEQFELSQLRVLELVASKDMKRIFRAFHKVDACEATDVHLNVGTMLRNEEGKQRHFTIDMHPVFTSGAKVDSYFGICRDNTEQLIIYDHLKEAIQHARELEHLKQTFLRNMSYSIRHPLDIIRKSIDRFAATTDQDIAQRHLDSIIGSTQRLITLSDDTLQLSRIEAGLFVPASKRINFVDVFREACEEGLKDYRSDNVVYNIEDAYDTLELYADPVVLKRILREAVALSARYTQFGTLSVRYLYRRGSMRISVHDTGHGIPPSVLENIFEPRIGESYPNDSKMASLSGLEMPICKALVDTMKGTIDIESDPARGTSIYITLNIPERA